MSYVICHRTNGKYLKLNGCKGDWVNLLKKATRFQTSTKAANFIENNLSGSCQGVISSDVRILNADNLVQEYCPDGSQFTKETANQALIDMIAFYEQVIEKTEKYLSLPAYYGDVVKQCDMETLDILHKMEFTNENVVNGFKRYKQMQEVRQRRREAKDSLEFASLIVSSGLLSCLEKLRADIAELKESEKTKEYRPRVLTSMFDDPEEE